MWVGAQDVYASDWGRCASLLAFCAAHLALYDVCQRCDPVSRNPRHCWIAAFLRSTMPLAIVFVDFVVLLIEGHRHHGAPDGHRWSLSVVVSATNRRLLPSLEARSLALL